MWFSALFTDSNRTNAATQIQAATRGRRVRAEVGPQSMRDIEKTIKLRMLVTSALQCIHAGCDLKSGGASCGELLERIALDDRTMQGLGELRPQGAAKLLRSLQIERWLECDGRVSLDALLALI